MMFIDTHAHLYDEQFLTDRDAMMQRALYAGVTRIYLPNCDHTTIEPMMSLVAAYPDNCFPMMGLHPVYVKEDFQAELHIARNWLERGGFVAIGEIGLDKYWDQTFLPQQREAFDTQISWALDFHLPIIIHSREATTDCLDMVAARQDGRLSGIFHCFSGTVAEARRVVELGFYLGIGGVATFKKTNLPEIIREVGIGHIVLETDAPYLAPVPYRGKRNESSYIPLVAEAVSNALAMPVSEVAGITTLNAEKVFGVR